MASAIFISPFAGGPVISRRAMERLPGFRDFYPEPVPHKDVWSADARQYIFGKWREAARHLNGSAERLIATIEQSFPPAGEIAKRFAFETRLFQIAAPEGIRQVRRHCPTLRIFTAAIDVRLNERGFIVPGLGDAGDRLFGTK